MDDLVKEVVNLLHHDLSPHSTNLKSSIQSLKNSLESHLQKQSPTSRLSQIKQKFFSVDQSFTSKNFHQLKKKKKWLLYQMLLEKRNLSKTKKGKNEEIEKYKNLRFIFNMKLKNNQTQLSYSTYHDCISQTCRLYPYKEIENDLPKDSKILEKLKKIAKKKKLEDVNPSFQRLIYCCYCHVKDEKSGNVYEYIYVDSNNSKSLHGKFNEIFPNHMYFVDEFKKCEGNETSANLFERFLAVFGVKNVHVFIIDKIEFDQYAKFDPMIKRVKDIKEKEFSKNLIKSSLGLNEK